MSPARRPREPGETRTRNTEDLKSPVLPLNYRPEISRRRDSNPQPSAYEADELPVAPLRSSGGRIRTCDPRLNRAIFCLLNYAGKIPGQEEPDQGLLHDSVGYPVLKSRRAPGTRDRQTRSSRSRNRKYTKTGPFVNRLRTIFVQKVVHWWTDPVEYGCCRGDVSAGPGAQTMRRTVMA
jgi:hypothetical protein